MTNEITFHSHINHDLKTEIMQNDFEELTDPVSTNTDNPIQLTIEYKPGETDATWASMATPEKLIEANKLGFSYYNKDTQSRVILESATFYILRQYLRLGGKIWESRPARSFESNLTHDLRTDRISFRESYVKGGLKKIGTKDEVRAWANAQGLPNGATGVNIILVCYCPELNAVVEIKATKRIEVAIAKAIKNASGRAPGRSFLFDLCSIDTRFLAFGFTGQYAKVKKPLPDQIDEGKEYDGNGQLLFEPVFRFGEITIGKNPNRHAQLKYMSDLVEEYVCAVKSRIAAHIERSQSEMKYPQEASSYAAPEPQYTPPTAPVNPAYQPPPSAHNQAQPFPVFTPPPAQQAPTWQNPPMDPNPTAEQIRGSADDLPF